MNSLVLIIALFLAHLFTAKAQWTQCNVHNDTVMTLLIKDQKLFAGSYGGGIRVSDDDGETWTAMSSGLTNFYVRCFASHNQLIYTGTHNGVYRSNDNGMYWKKLGLNQGIWSVVAAGNTMFAGTYGGGVFITTDEGQHWKTANISLGNLDILSLSLIGQRLFAGTSAGIYSSDKNVLYWEEPGLNHVYIPCIMEHGKKIFAGTLMGIYVSNNNGKSWEKPFSDVLNTTFSIITHGQRMFAGTFSGVYVSDSIGENWKYIGLENMRVYSLTANNTYVFAGTDKGIWKLSLNTVNSIEEKQNYDNQLTLILSPNPTKGVINFFVNNRTGNSAINLEIFSMQGEKIFEQEIRELSHTIDIQYLDTGMYYVIARAGNNSTRQLLSIVK